MFFFKISRKLLTPWSLLGLIIIENHIEAILEGFPEEYDAFITSVTSQTNPYTVDQVQALLLA